ncbi:glycosylphosphatidylinositol anchor biosynthesis protein 11 [Dipodascopsis tothii]|uniref:glycosylphosphatidylinositol anchor biosynthesis protein 11 n=1 Tax=Dipodascopsis tothii TaxID=44089 RepID=UPI0034CDC672
MFLPRKPRGVRFSRTASLAAGVATAAAQIAGTAALLYSGTLAAAPARTLWRALPVAVVLQAIAAETAPENARRTQSWMARVYVGVLTAALTAAVYLAYVLMGAPPVSHVAETAALSAHTALLVVYPLLATYGVDARAWAAAGAGPVPASAAGAVAGAWLGAVPIPLDWDRPWQQWPVPVVAGAVVGAAVGRVAALVRM